MAEKFSFQDWAQEKLENAGFGTLEVRGFKSLIRQKRFEDAKEQFPKQYKEYIIDKRKKPKRKSKGGYTTKQRTGTTDYRKGGMTLSTVSNRNK
jgi:hypothetical protein